MRLSTWRPNLTQWLSRVIRVDSWLVDRPEIGQSVGLLPPLRSINYQHSQAYEVSATATQDLFVTLRYPDSVAYKDLPLGALEGAYQTLSYYLTLYYGDISEDLVDCPLIEVSDPIMVSETGDRTGEWVVTLHWCFQPSWYASPEPGPLTPGTGLPTEGYPVNQITTGIWRQPLDTSVPPILDFRFSLQKDPTS